MGNRINQNILRLLIIYAVKSTIMLIDSCQQIFCVRASKTTNICQNLLWLIKVNVFSYLSKFFSIPSSVVSEWPFKCRWIKSCKTLGSLVVVAGG